MLLHSAKDGTAAGVKIVGAAILRAVSIRVLHVSASFPRSDTDSTAPFLADLTNLQREAGWEVAVLATHDQGLPGRHVVGGADVRRARYAPDRFEVLAYRGGGHKSLRSPAHALLLPGLLASLAANAAAEIRRFRPDVVHAHWILPSGLVLASFPKRARPRAVLTMHGNDVELASSKVARPVARAAARRADALLAVSDPLARRADEVLGLPAGTVSVARLPVPSELTPTPFPAGPLRLLAAGRASYEKGFDVLLAALAPATEHPFAGPQFVGPQFAEPQWRVTLVTDGPERPRLEAQAAAAGLGDSVSFLPLQPRAALFDLMREHHAVVVPSRAEGLGMLALEALALGRPVVASRVGGLTDVVTDGDDGSLVPPDDPAALGVALANLAGSIRAPRAEALARHSDAAVLDAHARAYAIDTAKAPKQ